MEFDLWAQLPSVLPEVGLTALAIIVLFADIYGSPSTRRNVVFISALGMALLALVPLIWQPDPALYESWNAALGRHGQLRPALSDFQGDAPFGGRGHLPDGGRRQRRRGQRRVLSDRYRRHARRTDDVERERSDPGFRGAGDPVDPALHAGRLPPRRSALSRKWHEILSLWLVRFGDHAFRFQSALRVCRHDQPQRHRGRV